MTDLRPDAVASAAASQEPRAATMAWPLALAVRVMPVTSIRPVTMRRSAPLSRISFLSDVWLMYSWCMMTDQTPNDHATGPLCSWDSTAVQSRRADGNWGPIELAPGSWWMTSKWPFVLTSVPIALMVVAFVLFW